MRVNVEKVIDRDQKISQLDDRAGETLAIIVNGFNQFSEGFRLNLTLYCRNIFKIFLIRSEKIVFDFNFFFNPL